VYLVINCLSLSIPAHVTISTNKIVFGTTVSARSDPGYMFIDGGLSMSLQCIESIFNSSLLVWNDMILNCTGIHLLHSKKVHMAVII